MSTSPFPEDPTAIVQSAAAAARRTVEGDIKPLTEALSAYAATRIADLTRAHREALGLPVPTADDLRARLADITAAVAALPGAASEAPAPYATLATGYVAVFSASTSLAVLSEVAPGVQFYVEPATLETEKHYERYQTRRPLGFLTVGLSRAEEAAVEFLAMALGLPCYGLSSTARDEVEQALEWLSPRAGKVQGYDDSYMSLTVCEAPLRVTCAPNSMLRDALMNLMPVAVLEFETPDATPTPLTRRHLAHILLAGSNGARDAALDAARSVDVVCIQPTGELYLGVSEALARLEKLA